MINKPNSASELILYGLWLEHHGEMVIVRSDEPVINPCRSLYDRSLPVQKKNSEKNCDSNANAFVKKTIFSPWCTGSHSKIVIWIRWVETASTPTVNWLNKRGNFLRLDLFMAPLLIDMDLPSSTISLYSEHWKEHISSVSLAIFIWDAMLHTGKCLQSRI